MIYLHLEVDVAADVLGGLLNWLRHIPAGLVDLTIRRFSHPAMPDAVLVDAAVLSLDGVLRVRGAGRTAHAAIEKARERLADQQHRASGSARRG